MSRKIDHIEKKNIYQVPDDYFDKLPGIIQSRAVNESKKKSLIWATPAVKYALPALVVVIMAGYYAFFNNPDAPKTATELLAEIDTDDLVDYLAYSEITTEEILEASNLDDIEFDFETEDIDLLNDSDIDELEGVFDEFIDINEL